MKASPQYGIPMCLTIHQLANTGVGISVRPINRPLKITISLKNVSCDDSKCSFHS